MTRETSSRLSRRNLLAGLGFGVAAVGAIATPALSSSWLRKGGAKDGWNGQFVSLSRATADQWSAQVGTSFLLAGGIVAQLIEVTPLSSPGRRPAGLRDGAFALVFESAGAALPPGERIHQLSHVVAGTMKVYFSSCRDKCGGHRLHAIFN